MSQAVAPPIDAAGGAKEAPSFWNDPNPPAAFKGLEGLLGKKVCGWLFSLDHKRIGIMYLIGITATILLGGCFALTLRLSLWSGTGTFLTADQYNQMFTLHGAVMVFLFIIPSIPAILGNLLLPIMLGAKDVAFPRLNLASFYLWVGGAVFFVWTLVAGGLDTGWTFYTPYSTSTNTAVTQAVMGAFILGFSSIFTGMNFIVTVHTMRPKGMTWARVPLFLWGLYATAVIQVLATPVLAITLLLLAVERGFGIGIFDPKLGGDPVLFQHFFWFYSHPAVYIMVLPGMGVISEIIGTFSRRPIFGARFIAMSSVAIALLGFLVWGHHMFVSGQSKLASVIFSAITFTIAIPTAIKVFNWIATLHKASISLDAPMLYALGFILVFGIGGLTGIFLAAISVDVHLTDTYFVVAHFHYVMVGGTLMAFLGGMHYWWPKIFGVMYPEKLARIMAVIFYGAFNLTFFPQFVMGSRGMPRRYAHYKPEFEIFHRISTVGVVILGATLFVILVYLLRTFKTGKKAPMNPWGGGTLEWATSSPPPTHNFEVTPVAGEPYDLSTLERAKDGGWVRKNLASEGDGHGAGIF